MTMSNTPKQPGPIVLDVEGLTLNANDIRRIQHPLTGGVILFGRNYQDRKQLCALTAAIRKVRSDVLICIDHEGGRVQRARTDGFTHLPAMGKLGALWEKDVLLATQAATASGYVLAAELRACGVDFSYTPVLDLDYGQSSIIGDRAFHRDPRIVTLLAKSLNHGLELAGMRNCGKHFPGHGYVAADSHIAIPVDKRSKSAVLKEDAAPYQWHGLGLSSVMPAHVIYPKVDSQPAGFSKIWLQDILRKQYGFEGVIFSDDLSMEGASVAGSVTQGAMAALKAGCDMVLICNSPAKADQLLNELPAKGDVKARKASQARICKLFPKGEALSWKALQADAEYVAALKLLRACKLIK